MNKNWIENHERSEEFRCAGYVFFSMLKQGIYHLNDDLIILEKLK